MLRNYLMVSLRNVLRDKVFSVINVLGLSIGIGASLLIVNYLRFEKSYDTFHTNFDRIFRVPMKIQEKDGPLQTFAFTYPAVAGAMRNDFPEVEQAIRLRRIGGLVNVDDKAFADVRMFFADPAVFDVFTLPIVHGNTSALNELNNAVVTESLALKLFGEVDARGKTFRFFDDQVFSVSAVIRDLPENSHLQFDFLLPYKRYVETLKEVGADAETNWGWSDYYTYVLLRPGQDPEQVRNKLPAFAERYKGESMKARAYTVQFQLQPLAEIHTKSPYDYEFAGNGNFTYLSYLSFAAIFVMVMAWLNYINLTTSKSLRRAKEVGVRKAAGALRAELLMQFLIDALTVNTLAVAAGILIFALANPHLAALTGKPLAIPSFGELSFWGGILGGLLLGSILSGFYPAIILSGFRPVAALKGVSGNASGGTAFFRKALVVVQIALAVLLLSGTWALVSQVRFMQQKDLGVNIRETLVLRDRANHDSTYVLTDETFIQELEKLPIVRSAAASTDVPGKEVGGSSDYRQPSDQNPKRCRNYEVDLNFFENYEMRLLGGRSFEQSDAYQRVVVLNHTAATTLGFETPEAAIQSKITNGSDTLTVIGVLQDFHQKSLQHDIKPIVFRLEDYNWSYYSIKLAGTVDQDDLADIEALWLKFFPDSPFEYFFLDAFYDAQYKSEQMFHVLLNVFTCIGLLIAGLGLVGLSLFTISRRTKEMGIRRALGASVTQLVNLFVVEYVALTGLAFVVAIPLSYYLASNWLQGYAFRTTLGVWFIVLPLLGILVLTLASVGIQSLFAAMSNPTRSLRSE